MTDLLHRITTLQAEISQLEAQLPAHSVKPWMLQRIEDLEDELAELKRQQTLERPIPGSYWVEPGRFLAGEYPGRPLPELSRKRLLAFLRAGFDTFIDLTTDDERESYFPILQAEAPDFDLTVTHQRSSIGDFGLPRQAQMTAILNTIDTALANGHKIYLHCWAGVGRTGTTVGCYLVRHGMSGSQALAHLDQLFRTSEQSAYYSQSPETQAQVKFVLNWHEPSP